MARGHPFLWSAVLGLPFVSGGSYVVVTDIATRPLIYGVPIIAFGIFIFFIGLYIQFVTPSEPEIRDSEELVDTRYPSQKVAMSKIIIGIPFLIVTAYLLFFTNVAYVFPTLTLIFGLYFFSSGLKTYWANTLTTYYITSERVIREYRFIALRRQGLPLDKIRAVEERKSIIETLVGLGNIRIASGGGGGSVELRIRNIGGSTRFANKIRNLM